jgi:ankyrin repeat protein
LHFACANKAPLELIQFLVEKGGSHTVQATNVNGHLPLHYACIRAASLEVIVYLVSLWVEAVTSADKDGDFPLHMACEANARLEVVQYLVEQWSEAITKTNKDGDLPLHMACEANARLEVVQFLVEQWPEAITKTNVKGSLPLHVACKNMAPLEVVQQLVGQWPEAVKMKDSDGNTPLHYVRRWPECLWTQKREVVSWLQEIGTGRITKEELQHMIEVAQQRSEEEESTIGTQLHDLCCDQPQSIDRIRSLVTACPEAIKAAGSDGWLPLHFACANTAPLQVVGYMVDSWPEAIKMADYDGCLPLHVACANAALLQVVEYLVDNWPKAVKMKNSDGLLPLHAVCSSEKASLDLIVFLVNQWPEAVNITDSFGRTPLDYAKMSAADGGNPNEEVIRWLQAVNGSLITVSIPSEQLPASTTSTPEPGLKSSHSQSGISETKFKVEREEIPKAIALKRDAPVAVSQEYVDEILTNVQLGQGFFGVVWKGVDTVLNTTFAVKAIHQELVQHGHSGDVQAARATFQRELDVRTAENRLL